MTWTGIDSDRARHAADQLRRAVSDIEGLRASHAQVVGLTQDPSLLTSCRQFHDEFAAETSALADLLSDTAALADFADSRWSNPHAVSMMERMLGSGFDRLETSLNDELGSRGSGFERALFGITDIVFHEGTCAVPGDLGGTYSLEERFPWFVYGDDASERGRNAVIRGLHDTANDCQIGPDEFEIVKVEDDRYVVVIPGVTDLSAAATNPLGLLSWNPDHRSVRATFMAARRSALSTDIARNLYAQMVQNTMEAEVPHGAEVMIIGHSFGADTALDLAADPTFNAAGRYDVTHVVAAAYHSGPQLPSVPSSTQVLVLQNSADLVVVAESALDQPSVAIHGAIDSVSSARDYDIDGVADGAGDALEGAGRSIIDGTRWFCGGGGRDLGIAVTDDVVDHVSGFDVPISDESIVEVFHLDPGVSQVTESQVAVVFDGGTSHAGHHQDHYIGYVEHADEASVTTFFESVDEAGYTANGTSLAVDVSVPG